MLTPQSVADSFGPQMLDAAACRRWVVNASRGDQPVCPSCGVALTALDFDRLLDGKSITCICGVSSSARTGTPLEGSTITDRQFVFILAMLHHGICPDRIAAMADCSRATVYNWRKRLEAGG